MNDMKIKVILEEANVNKDFFTSNRKENNLKCPFCQQELQEDVGYDGDYSCPNCKEPYFGSPELWQELIRTRKALETIRLHLMAAKGRFDFYDEYLVSGKDTPHARFKKEEIEKSQEQITALEQKDVK